MVRRHHKRKKPPSEDLHPDQANLSFSQEGPAAQSARPRHQLLSQVRAKYTAGRPMKRGGWKPMDAGRINPATNWAQGISQEGLPHAPLLSTRYWARAYQGNPRRAWGNRTFHHYGVVEDRGLRGTGPLALHAAACIRPRAALTLNLTRPLTARDCSEGTVHMKKASARGLSANNR